MPDSVLDAIRMGIWDFEPEQRECDGYRQTQAMPGTEEKLNVLADRIRQGLPLWHPSDRVSYEEDEF